MADHCVGIESCEPTLWDMSFDAVDVSFVVYSQQLLSLDLRCFNVTEDVAKTRLHEPVGDRRKSLRTLGVVCTRIVQVAGRMAEICNRQDDFPLFRFA